MSNNTNSSTKYKPDADTLERMRYLGQVGAALNETASDTTFLTNFFLAKEALNHYLNGLEKLEIEPEVKKGMTDLIEYLQKKIDRRIKYADSTGDSPMIQTENA